MQRLSPNTFSSTNWSEVEALFAAWHKTFHISTRQQIRTIHSPKRVTEREAKTHLEDEASLAQSTPIACPRSIMISELDICGVASACMRGRTVFLYHAHVQYHIWEAENFPLNSYPSVFRYFGLNSIVNEIFYNQYIG